VDPRDRHVDFPKRQSSSSMAKHQEKLYSFMWDLLEKKLRHWTGKCDVDGTEQPLTEMEIRNLLQVACFSLTHVFIQLSSRHEMDIEKEKLYSHLSKLDTSSMPLAQEYELIALVISQAVLNSCENPHVLKYSILMMPPDHTDWDVERYADKVKNTKVTKDGGVKCDVNLRNYFPPAICGEVTKPSTVLDCNDRIVLWNLPGILYPGRVVRWFNCGLPEWF
jgi:hypothetical protein